MCASERDLDVSDVIPCLDHLNKATITYCIELCSMLCASLDERGAWGELDIYVCG